MRSRVEHVVSSRVAREIRVLDRGDSDGPSDRGEFSLGEPMSRSVGFRGPHGDRFGASVDRSLQKVHQFEVGAGPRLEGFLVRAQDRAEAEVDEFGFHAVRERRPADLPAGVEDVSKVITLAGVDHVDDFVAVEFLNPVSKGGEVGGRVEKATVSFANEHGAFAVFESDHQRAVVLDCETGADERIDDFREFVSKTRFTPFAVGSDPGPEKITGEVDLLHRDFDEAFPGGHHLGVAGLQVDQRFAGRGLCVAGALLLSFEFGDPVGAAVIRDRGLQPSARRRGLQAGRLDRPRSTCPDRGLRSPPSDSGANEGSSRWAAPSRRGGSVDEPSARFVRRVWRRCHQ